MKASKLLIVTLVVVILGIAGFFLYRWYYFPISGWKVIEGCVDNGTGAINYQFYGLDKWQLVTDDMGCGMQHENAQSFGLKDKDIGNRIDDVAQITIALYDSKPSKYDGNYFMYLSVPDQDGIYLELGRISATTPITTYSINDDEWSYVKKSFRFK